jgi:hypothetical protein
MIPAEQLTAGLVNPAYLSEEENEFLLAHLGESPAVALRSVSGGVNANAVRPILEKVAELEELSLHRGEQWLGIEGLKQGIATYLTQFRSWRSDKRRGAVKFPSMYTYTSKGRPIRGGIGADSSIVQSYFTPQGERVSFIVNLFPDGVEEWQPFLAHADEPAPSSGLFINHELSRIECFCGHVDKFNSESRASYNAARARMSKHLRAATEEVEKHREIYAKEFGG